ncbi:MAG TPA: ion transporter [Verrucomicrobiae bacterium]|nr:ion transporter [Verrucomicrobiae bacterium]
MSDLDLRRLENTPAVASWRLTLGRRLESLPVQHLITTVILINAAVLGLQASPGAVGGWSGLLEWVDRICLIFFVTELVLRFVAYRGLFWRSGWNWFDFAVVAIALAPNAGPWAVLRSLRVLRVLRLLTVVPQMRKVVAAFLHSIPGLSSVVAVMTIFFYTAGVLATGLFAETHPQWFGSLGKSLYTLFQIMTLESWSMGIVRPVMEAHPWAWAFFVPFIVIATFTILNLFIGIIVSTMQELSSLPDPNVPPREVSAVLARMEADLKQLRASLDHKEH